MRELLEAFSGEGGKHLAPVLFFVVAGLTWIALTFINRWYKHRQAEIDAALKHEMLQRGMSADDIERILAAGPPKKAESSSANHET
ncbi:MAG: hypothetical protein HY040_14940 [Planctomycetes bacterium]|nr:hypothetical protein [Planctomycetota bacterium]